MCVKRTHRPYATTPIGTKKILSQTSKLLRQSENVFTLSAIEKSPPPPPFLVHHSSMFPPTILRVNLRLFTSRWCGVDCSFHPHDNVEMRGLAFIEQLGLFTWPTRFLFWKIVDYRALKLRTRRSNIPLSPLQIWRFVIKIRWRLTIRTNFRHFYSPSHTHVTHIHVFHEAYVFVNRL